MDKKPWSEMPHKAVGAVAMFTDAEGKILLLKPTYIDKIWNLPGGFVDDGEAPRAAIVREVREELGLERDALELVSVCYVDEASDGHENITFGFWGGMLSEEEIAGLRLQEEEVSACRFVTPEEAYELLDAHTAQIVRDRDRGAIAYAEVRKKTES